MNSRSSWDFLTLKYLTDAGEKVQKWTRLISTRRWVILVARTRRKKKEENPRVHFWTFSPVDKFRVLACIGWVHFRGVLYKKENGWFFRNGIFIYLDSLNLVGKFDILLGRFLDVFWNGMFWGEIGTGRQSLQNTSREPTKYCPFPGKFNGAGIDRLEENI